MPRWIHIWHDSPMEADALFSITLADRDLVTDDEDAWMAYITALNALAIAREQVQRSLRQPTEDEREAYRAKIREDEHAHNRASCFGDDTDVF